MSSFSEEEVSNVRIMIFDRGGERMEIAAYISGSISVETCKASGKIRYIGLMGKKGNFRDTGIGQRNLYMEREIFLKEAEI